MNRPTRRSLFRAYNDFRKADQYKTDGGRKRLNRGLGVAMSNRWGVDGTTMTTRSERVIDGQRVAVTHRTHETGCTCEDHNDARRGHPVCKHMIARALIGRAWRYAAADQKAARAQVEVSQPGSQIRTDSVTKEVSMR